MSLRKLPVLLVVATVAWIAYTWLPELLAVRYPEPGTVRPDLPPFSPSPSPREIVQYVVTAVLLAAGLFVILSKRYPPKDKHWAYGVVGTVVGFWLRP
jgi:hypothetical protein